MFTSRAGAGEVDVGVEELVDQRADGVGLGERRELVAELEVVEDVLDVGREAVEVVLEVGEQLLLAAAGLEIAQRELRRVVERLASGIAERGALLGDARLVEHLLGFEHRLLGRLQHRVHAADDAHRQDHVRVLAALEEVAQDIVGDAPDEGDDLVVRCLVHCIQRFAGCALYSSFAPFLPSQHEFADCGAGDAVMPST